MLHNIKELFKTKLKDIDLLLLVILVFSLPFERIPSVEIAGITTRLSMVIGLVVILRAGYLVLTKQKKIRWSLPYLLIGVFLAWVFLIVPESINVKRALQVFVFDSFVMLLAAAVSILYKKEHIKYLLSALFLITTITCIFSYYQFFGDIIGMPNMYTGLAERYTSGVFGFPRVQAFSLEPLYFGSFLLIGIMASLSALLLNNQEIIKRRINYVLLFVFTNVLFITTARSAIYAFIFGSVCLYIAVTVLKNIKLSALVLPTLVIIASFGFALLIINYGSKLPIDVSKTFGKKGVAAYAGQLTNIGLGGEGDERVQARRDAIKLLSNNKSAIIIGIGPGQFGPYISSNQIQSYGWPIVNNLPLEILLEEGLVGFIAIVIFLLYIISLSYKRMMNHEVKGLSQVFLLALVSYLLTQFIQYQAFSTLYIIHLWVIIGLIIGITIVPKINSWKYGKKST